MHACAILSLDRFFGRILKLETKAAGGSRSSKDYWAGVSQVAAGDGTDGMIHGYVANVPNHHLAVD